MIRVWSIISKGVQSSIFNQYRSRVIADGGIVEAFSCTIAALRLP